MHSKLLVQIALPPNLSSCSSPTASLFCQRGCFSFCPRRAGFSPISPPDELPLVHQFHFPVPHKHIPCTSLNSSSSPLFDLLCPGDSVFACIHLAFPFKNLSRIVLIRSRHSSLCGFVAVHAMQTLRIVDNLQCVLELQCPQTRRRIFSAQLPAFFQPEFLAMGVPLLFFCQL